MIIIIKLKHENQKGYASDKKLQLTTKFTTNYTWTAEMMKPIMRKESKVNTRAEENNKMDFNIFSVAQGSFKQQNRPEEFKSRKSRGTSENGKC